MSQILSLFNLTMQQDCFGLNETTPKLATGMDRDIQLLKEIAKGDGEAFSEFIGKWKKPIYAFFLRSSLCMVVCQVVTMRKDTTKLS